MKDNRKKEFPAGKYLVEVNVTLRAFVDTYSPGQLPAIPLEECALEGVKRMAEKHDLDHVDAELKSSKWCEVSKLRLVS